MLEQQTCLTCTWDFQGLSHVTPHCVLKDIQGHLRTVCGRAGHPSFKCKRIFYIARRACSPGLVVLLMHNTPLSPSLVKPGPLHIHKHTNACIVWGIKWILEWSYYYLERKWRRPSRSLPYCGSLPWFPSCGIFWVISFFSLLMIEVPA